MRWNNWAAAVLPFSSKTWETLSRGKYWEIFCLSELILIRCTFLTVNVLTGSKLWKLNFTRPVICKRTKMPIIYVHYLYFNACVILYKRLWNFILWQGILNRLLNSNEPSQIIFWYFVTHFRQICQILGIFLSSI